MEIDRNLLKEFAKITNDSEVKTENKYLRGTIVKTSGGKYVRLDGSTTVTPISEIVDVEEGDRVLVSIENHKATIVGNFTFPPSARKEQEAINKSEAAQETANQADTTANAAQQKAQEASDKADTAISQSSIASASADEAKEQATEAINKANTASTNATEAKNLATQASSDATEAKEQAAASQASSAEAQAEVTRLQGEVNTAKENIDGALAELETQAGEITGIKETYSTKVETEQAKADLTTEITKKVGELETKVTENYSTKTENTELEGRLQTQITQNAEGLSSQATKVEKLESDTTKAQKDVADALSKASAAQSAATEARTKADAAKSAADTASANASAASEKATLAKNAADAASAAANAADKKVQDAQSDLNEAKQNLASVTSRVNATEADIAEAQSKVDAAQTAVNNALADAAEANLAATKAQETADKAQQDAETAQGIATTAQQKADNAKTAADNAQTAANKAQADVAALTSRVTTAETNISQNSEKIELNANKTTEIGDNLKNNYYNKTETDAKIKVESDKISSTVSRVETVEKTAVTSNVEEFYLSTSPTSLSGGSWSKTQPTWTQGKYIWRRFLVTKGDGTTSYSPSSNGVCITGNTGATGANGTNYWRSTATIDLSNTTTYDVNKWYPVIGTALPTTSYNRIVAYVALNSGTKPSWSTHVNGFSVNLDLAVIGSGWGTTNGECIIYADTYSFCSVSPASFKQLTYGSIPVLYLRGGGKYFVKTDYVCTWTPKPNGYTWTSGNYSQSANVLDSRPTPTGTNIKGKTSYLHIAYATNSTGTEGFSTIDSINKTYIGQYTDFTSTDSTDPTAYNWTLIKGDKGDKGDKGNTGAAGQNGISLSNGTSLYKDTLFKDGNNGCSIYNNSSNSNVSVTRQAKSSDNPYSNAEYELMIKTIGSASPGCGGIMQFIQSRANAIFVRRVIAKIPTGRTLACAQNDMGTGFKIKWLTSTAGTGKFEEYMYMYTCGATGNFSTGGHMYINGGSTPTKEKPLIWYVASCETFDITTEPIDLDNFATDENLNEIANNLDTRIDKTESSIEQLAGMISNLITDEKGGSLMTQTENGWTFNMSSINGNLKAIKEAMSNMEIDKNKTNSAVEKLTNLINDIADRTAYITMATDENGNPCIELGKTDSSNTFKVRITNEAIDFMEGSTKIAYANNNTFYAGKMIVKKELQIGEGPGFVWRTRANGNMGLVYISV